MSVVFDFTINVALNAGQSAAMTTALADDRDVRRAEAHGDLNHLGFHVLRLRDNTLSFDIFAPTVEFNDSDLATAQRQFAVIEKTDENAAEYEELSEALDKLRAVLKDFELIEISHSY